MVLDRGLELDGCRDSYQREAGMDLGNERAIADRFAAYVGELTKVIGHADLHVRRNPCP